MLNIEFILSPGLRPEIEENSNPTNINKGYEMNLSDSQCESLAKALANHKISTTEKLIFNFITGTWKYL